MKIRLFPTAEQKTELASLFNKFRWYYNYGIDILTPENMKNASFRGKIIDRNFRDIARKYTYKEEYFPMENMLFMEFVKSENVNEFPRPSYWEEKDVHNRIPRGAFKNLIGNVNSAKSNFKAGNIRKFRLSYKTKKDKNYTAIFEDASYPKWINRISGHYKCGRKSFSFAKIRGLVNIRSISVSLDRESGRYYLYLPVERTFTLKGSENQAPVKVKHDYISLDTGIRTFQTGFAGNHIVEIGKESSRLFSLLEKIDAIEADMAKSNRRKRERLRRRKIRAYRSIRCLVEDIHWKTCFFLTTNYQNIILPDFRISLW